MKKIFIYIFFSFMISGSFGQGLNYGKPIIEPKTILKDFNSFWIYLNDDVKMFGDFIALDTSLNVITKDAFLKSLTSGKYLPLLLHSKDTSAYYKLFTLNSSVNGGDIKEAIKNWATNEYAHYQMEGQPLPEFNFVDLDGNGYTKETTKGKILVLKCWFIGCQQCIEEMPDLNKMVKQYKDRNDVIFVSLATDTQEKLKTFLKKREFNYSVIPEQRKYIVDDLQTNYYPTHLVINKQGLISKVVNNYKDLASALHKETAK